PLGWELRSCLVEPHADPISPSRKPPVGPPRHGIVFLNDGRSPLAGRGESGGGGGISPGTDHDVRFESPQNAGRLQIALDKRNQYADGRRRQNLSKLSG